MKINKKVFNLSSWLTLFSVLFIPGINGQVSQKNTLSFGFPIRFYTRYIDTPSSGTWIFDDSFLNLAGLLLNIVIIYFVIIGVKMVIDKIKAKKIS